MTSQLLRSLLFTLEPGGGFVAETHIAGCQGWWQHGERGDTREECEEQYGPRKKLRGRCDFRVVREGKALPPQNTKIIFISTHWQGLNVP